MEKELIDKLFGPPINQVLVPQNKRIIVVEMYGNGLMLVLIRVWKSS